MAPKPGKQHKVVKSRDKESSRVSDEAADPCGIALESCALTFPTMQIIDIDHSLPKYSTVVSRPDTALTMDDVDRIQLELEVLLSTAVQRRNTVAAELKILGNIEKKRGRPPGSSPGSPGKVGRNAERSLKRFKETPRAKDTSSSAGSPSMMSASSSSSFVSSTSTPSKSARQRTSSNLTDTAGDECMSQESHTDSVSSSAPVLVKNDIPERFWTSIEEYCGPITDKDIALLERLCEDQELVEDYLSVPSLGRHYSLRWADEDVVHDSGHESEPDCSAKSTNNCATNVSVKREVDVDDQFEGTSDTTSHPSTSNTTTSAGNHDEDTNATLGVFTQRLLSGLVGQQSTLSQQDAPRTDSEVLQRPSLAPAVIAAATTAAASGGATSTHTPPLTATVKQLEQRLKRELLNQGLLSDSEDCEENNPRRTTSSCNEDQDDEDQDDADDEVLAELRRCQRQLSVVSTHNMTQLKRLHSLATSQMQRQQVKNQLAAVDLQVQEAYRAVTAARQKKRAPSDTECQAAWTALKNRDQLVRLLDSN